MDAQVLLDAAQLVFARDGLQGASLRAIARQAGCDPSLIYYHFANKEAMFAALLADRLPPLVSELRQLAEPRDTRHTAAKLWAVLGVFHGRFHASSGFRSMVRGEITRGVPGIQEMLLEHLTPAQAAIRAIVTEGQRLGHLRSGLIPVFVTFFLVRMEFEILDLVPAMAQPMAGLSPQQALPLAERAWFDLFWRGVAARPDEPLPPLPPFPECP
jgi:AcrR family transcriptional regulator